MKACAEIEPLLYLYAELTEPEKIRADIHINECNACRMMVESLSENNLWIQRAAQVRAAPPHAGRLTSRVMEAIARPKEEPSLAFLFVRPAMLAVSLMLMVFFSAEQMFTTQPVYKSMPETQTVTLNSDSFMNHTLARREKEKSNKVSLYTCAINGSCESVIVKKFILKKSGWL